MRPKRLKLFPSVGQYAVYPASVRTASQTKLLVKISDTDNNNFQFHGRVLVCDYGSYSADFFCKTWQTGLFRQVSAAELKTLRRI